MNIRNGLRDKLMYEMQRTVTPGYTVSDINVPLDSIVRHYNETGSLIIWSGGSDKAIFDRQSNWAFRAWHDWAHIRSGFGFSVPDECNTALYQMAEIQSTVFSRLVWIEVAEQALYLQRTGLFVDNQIDFYRRMYEG